LSSMSIFGIRVSIHPLFWIVILAAAVTGQFTELITLFALVIMHELGHVFTAISLGWRVSSMELLPFGGVAKVDESGTTTAKEEILVALAGPFVNVVMMAVGLILLWTGLWEASWAEFFIRGNLFIACFNLLPIWPLDGGKVLQALLSMILPFRKSVKYCIGWSCALSFALICSSFFLPYQWNLVLICTYLIIENRLTWKRVQYQFIRFLLAKREQNKLQRLHMPSVHFNVNRGEKIGEVVKLLKKGYYHHFSITDHQKSIVYSVSEEVVLSAYFNQHPQFTMSDLIVIR
jgi:stage IV sporulation protein FB